MLSSLMDSLTGNYYPISIKVNTCNVYACSNQAVSLHIISIHSLQSLIPKHDIEYTSPSQDIDLFGPVLSRLHIPQILIYQDEDRKIAIVADSEALLF
jgi:hypothetical protein